MSTYLILDISHRGNYQKNNPENDGKWLRFDSACPLKLCNRRLCLSWKMVSRHDGEGQRKLRSRGGGGSGEGKRVIFDARPYVKVSRCVSVLLYVPHCTRSKLTRRRVVPVSFLYGAFVVDFKSLVVLSLGIHEPEGTLPSISSRPTI